MEAGTCQVRTTEDLTMDWSAWTAADQLIAPNMRQLQLRCPGLAPLAQEVPQDADTLVLEPREGVRLSGQLRRSDDGTPLSGAGVQLRSPQWIDWPPWQAQSGEDGRFALEGLPPPPFEINVHHAGFEAQRLWLSALPEGDLAIELAPVGVLDLKLQGAKGPAHLWVSGLDLWPARETRVPEGAGQVRVEGLPGGEVRAWARTDTQIAGPSEPLEVTPGQTRTVTLTFQTAPTVTGIVSSLEGKPIADASVQVLPPDPGLPAQELVSDQKGRFESAALFQLPARLWVRAEGYVERVVEGQPPGPVEISLRPTTRLAGTVVDEAGEPIAGAEVWATGSNGESVHSSWAALLDPGAGELGITQGAIPRVPIAMAGAMVEHAQAARSDATGRFVLEGITAERVQVHATKAGYAPGLVDWQLPNDGRKAPLKVVLQRGGTLHGTVRDARDFEVAGVDVRLAETGGRAHRWSSSDERGEFLFEDLRGPVEVAAYEHGEAVDRCRLDIEQGDVVECALRVGEPRAALAIQLRQSTGEPIAGAHLLLTSAPEAGQPRTRQRLTGPGGQAVFNALPLEPHRLQVEAAGYVSIEPRTVEPQSEPSLELTLLPAGEVSGVVVDSLGAPTPGARVRARDADASVVTGEDGSFVIDGLSPGDATLVADLGPLASEPVHTRVRARERVAGLRLNLDGRAPLPSAQEEGAAESEVEAPDTPTTPNEEAEEPEEPEEPQEPPPLALEQQGAASVVVSVASGSEAARAGLSRGDVITHVDGEQVLSAGQARGMLRDPAGEVANVRIKRGRRRVTVRFRRPALP